MSPRAGLLFYWPRALWLLSWQILILGGHAVSGSVLGVRWMRNLNLHALFADWRRPRPLKQAEQFGYPADVPVVARWPSAMRSRKVAGEGALVGRSKRGDHRDAVLCLQEMPRVLQHLVNSAVPDTTPFD